MEKLDSSKTKISILFGLISSKLLLFWKNQKQFENNNFPEEIGDYAFAQEMPRKKISFTSFKIGIYVNRYGQWAVAKIWSGAKKDLDYYWLINEARAYRGMEYLYETYGELIREKFPEVSVPKIIKLEIGKNNIALLIEFLEGKRLMNFPTSKKIEIIERALQYFDYLGRFSDDAKFRKFFLQRSVFFILLSFIVSCIRVVIKFPQLVPGVFKALATFALNFPLALKKGKCRLVHRDLTLTNILLAEKGGIQIIDFGLAVFTNEMLEIAQVLEGALGIDDFNEKFYKTKVMEKILSDKNLFKRYKFFSLYTSMYALSINSPLEFDLACSYFKHILNLKK